MLDTLPNLHAALVHFPIGLLFTAVAADLTALATPQRAPLKPAATGLHLAGTGCLIATYVAGRSAAMTVFTPGMAHGLVHDHWNLALVVMIYFGVLTVGRVCAVRVVTDASWRLWGVLMVAGIVGLLGLAVAAERGGQLVYRWGVGVAAP